MQKKCLLFVMAFSCVVQAIAIDNEQSASKDPYADLREDLRIRRENKDNALYADKMVAGSEAIKAVNVAKMKELEKDRQDKRRKISSAAWYMFWSRPEMDSWFYAENKDTTVYKEDKALNEESSENKKYYTDLANGYENYSNFLHKDVSFIVKSNLDVQTKNFERMYTALNKCNNDHHCYARYYPSLSYKKIMDRDFRNKRKAKAFKNGLEIAHSQDIPIILSELRIIMEKNPEIAAFSRRIEELDISIENLDPEKIKEREEKRIQDLEEQRIKEEEKKRQDAV
jgi:hypothetical protein